MSKSCHKIYLTYHSFTNKISNMAHKTHATRISCRVQRQTFASKRKVDFFVFDRLPVEVSVDADCTQELTVT